MGKNKNNKSGGAKGSGGGSSGNKGGSGGGKKKFSKNINLRRSVPQRATLQPLSRPERSLSRIVLSV